MTTNNKNILQTITLSQANEYAINEVGLVNRTVYFEACENSFEIEQKQQDNYKWDKNAIVLHKIEDSIQRPIFTLKDSTNKVSNNNLFTFMGADPLTSERITSQEILNKSKSAHFTSFSRNDEVFSHSDTSSSNGDNDDNIFNLDTSKFKSSPLSSVCPKISNINFALKDIRIDLRFLKHQLRCLPVKSKKVSNSNKHFRQLIELQNFYIDKTSIWVMKFSHDGNYLATGSKYLQIFELINYEYEDYQEEYNEKNILSYLRFISEKPLKSFNDHDDAIIDLAWSYHNMKQLLTASLDHLVLLWEVGHQAPLNKYTHGNMVTSVNFSPNNPNIFMSGCLDKFVRIWNINEETKPEYFNIKENITATAFFPSGDKIAVGTHNGNVIIYDLIPKLRYNCSFSCKNRMGKNYQGKKVTCIEFINKQSALITTADSRLRLVSMPDGKLIYKYKGHVNEEIMIRASNDYMNDLIICGSENGFCYVWNRTNKENSKKKNYSYEFFLPFSKDIVKCSMIANEKCCAGFFKKLFKLTTNIFVYSIIINATDQGRLQVLLNVEEIC